MPRSGHKALGAGGEADAARFLEAQGYRIVDVNVRPLPGMARGEIDLIAWDGDVLVFVEVKTRRAARGRQGTPAEAVDARKRRQLAGLAEAYLAKHDLDDVPCRFDLVAVVERPGAPVLLSLLVNAFEGG